MLEKNAKLSHSAAIVKEVAIVYRDNRGKATLCLSPGLSKDEAAGLLRDVASYIEAGPSCSRVISSERICCNG